jgi:hypothetical protein
MSPLKEQDQSMSQVGPGGNISFDPMMGYEPPTMDVSFDNRSMMKTPFDDGGMFGYSVYFHLLLLFIILLFLFSLVSLFLFLPSIFHSLEPRNSLFQVWFYLVS